MAMLRTARSAAASERPNRHGRAVGRDALAPEYMGPDKFGSRITKPAPASGGGPIRASRDVDFDAQVSLIMTAEFDPATPTHTTQRMMISRSQSRRLKSSSMFGI
jgi:hypothetical protein